MVSFNQQANLHIVQMTEYERYLTTEWEVYQAHPERFQATMAAVAGRNVNRVMDVGCGAGQELLPFLQRFLIQTRARQLPH